MTRPLAVHGRLLLAALALAGACKKAPPRPAPPVPISAAAVERRAVPYTIQANGVVEPLQTVAIQAQVGGVLKRVNFREGDDVKAGQVLFEIEPGPLAAALRQAQGVLARDEAQLRAAQADAQRFATLVEKEYVTAQQNEQARATAAALEATVESDRAAVQSARINLEHATVRSPIDGRAGRLQVLAGNLIRANSGITMVTINQIRPILVRFSVPAAELDQIRKYQAKQLAVRARSAGAGPGDSAAQGRLTFIDNAVDTTTGTILLKAEFPNKDAALWPGEFVSASLQLYVDPDALVVPISAVVTGQQGPYVFVVKPDQTTEVRNVKVARNTNDVAILTDGVKEGDQVVTEGQLRLTAGAKVQIKPPAGAAPAAPAAPAASQASTRGT
jgi:multidrug efflux system membrane fusion protein